MRFYIYQSYRFTSPKAYRHVSLVHVLLFLLVNSWKQSQLQIFITRRSEWYDSLSVLPKLLLTDATYFGYNFKYKGVINWFHLLAKMEFSTPLGPSPLGWTNSFSTRVLLFCHLSFFDNFWGNCFPECQPNFQWFKSPRPCIIQDGSLKLLEEWSFPYFIHLSWNVHLFWVCP